MTSHSKLLDNELHQLLKKDDHIAYTEIYLRYAYPLYTHAYKKLRDGDHAKEVVQDLFTNLWQKRKTIVITSNLAGYLFSALRNRILNFFAHQKVNEKYINSIKTFVVHSTANSADYLVREKEFTAYIERAISSLPPKMRLIFEMHKIEDRSYKDIAEELSISENNVSKQVNNALRLLKTKLGVVGYIYLLIKFLP